MESDFNLSESLKEAEIEKQESGVSQGTVTTSFTTANGHGLTFDPSSISIFDEIQLIIDNKDIEKVKNHASRHSSFRASMKSQRPNQQVVLEEIEEDFDTNDIPDIIDSTSILVEIIQQI